MIRKIVLMKSLEFYIYFRFRDKIVLNFIEVGNILIIQLILKNDEL